MRKPLSQEHRGMALIIVLAFVVLLTGLTIAYFSQTTADRQTAHTSFNQSNADQIASSGVAMILGDLRQEIINGSASPAPSFAPSPAGTPYYAYLPTSAANMVPKRSGTPSAGAAIPNLIRRSVRNDATSMPSPGFPSRASAVNSVTDPSANGRAVTLPRWNKHYLIPKLVTTGGDASTDPVTSFLPPDWVMVTAEEGAAVLSSPTTDSTGNTVTPVGRYAYAIYDVGGLLDINVAGYPTNSTGSQIGRKGSLGYADLSTQNILPYPIPNGGSGAYQLDKIIGWRNYATTQPSNNFPDTNFAANLQQVNSSAATNFYQCLISNTNGFLGPNPTATPYNNRTDQAFVTRQQLVAFRAALGFSPNALQHLTMFSRQPTAPSWSPATPTTTNPDFRTLRVTSSFPRDDGTIAAIGEPFVKKRFSLQRLNWLTYKGPSATSPGGTRNAVPTKTPNNATDQDWDLWLLTSRFGLTSTFLQDQSVGGTAANILKYFGLAWDPVNERWNYVGHSGGSSPLSSIATLGSLTGTRDPDFFELLQAGIMSSSLADSSSPDTTLLPVSHQQSPMLHVLTVGANLIAQSRADSYPVRIACTVNVNGSPTTMEAISATRLPYLNSLAVCPVAGTATSGPATGGINWLLVPNLWDPFRDTWDLTEASSTLTPNYLRPAVRISVSGSVGFGSVVASPSIKTGIIPSPSVTPFPSPSPGLAISPAQSIALTTPTATPGRGRNGFLEASRLDTKDCTPTPAPFTTTTSVSPTPIAQWNNVPYPLPTPTPTPPGTNVAFRISLPGSYIPTTTVSPAPAQNPVLILKPGFQMTLDYQSANGSWYPYSFLQGNNATNTWISGSIATNPSLNLTTTFSTYGRASPSSSPTTVAGSPAAPTAWNLVTLAQAPMFAKADPRSIRYNSQIGVVNLTSPPSATAAAAGIVASIWPNPYTAPPAMTIGSTSTPTPTPTPTPSVTPTPAPTATPNPPNPATLGDNAIAGNTANPYNESSGSTWRPVMMNRPFRSVGEMGYAFRDQPFKTLDFSSTTSADNGLLDLFTVNENNTATGMRAGVINLNTTQDAPLAAILAHTIVEEGTEGAVSPAPTPSPMPNTSATAAASSLVTATNSAPLQNAAELANWIATQGVLGATLPKTQKEGLARAFGEGTQTRTWNLMIDVVAQSGRYPPGANNLANFILEGEQHYWVHVAIDRLTGEVIDRQVEVVNE